MEVTVSRVGGGRLQGGGVCKGGGGYVYVGPGHYLSTRGRVCAHGKTPISLTMDVWSTAPGASRRICDPLLLQRMLGARTAPLSQFFSHSLGPKWAELGSTWMMQLFWASTVVPDHPPGNVWTHTTGVSAQLRLYYSMQINCHER